MPSPNPTTPRPFTTDELLSMCQRGDALLAAAATEFIRFAPAHVDTLDVLAMWRTCLDRSVKGVDRLGTKLSELGDG